MGKTKVVVYGGFGWLGQKLINHLYSLKTFDIHVSSVRAENYQFVEDELLFSNAQHVLCCVGRTHGPDCGTIDYLEDKLEMNLRDNLQGPLNIAMACQKFGIHMVYIGTGCIFDYGSEDPQAYRFSEESKPNFFGSGYSTVKGKTDQLMKNFEHNVLNCRIRMPIDNTSHPRNFITKIISYEKICSKQNSMTVLDTMIPIICAMMKMKVTGTFNMTNPEGITHNEILDMYIEKVDNQFTYTNFSVDEQNSILKSKRSNNILDTTKLERWCIQHNHELPTIKKAIRNVLENYKKTS